MKGDKIVLRALEPDDLTFLYNVENDISNWEVSETRIPYSKYLLKTYLDEAGASIEKVGQFRYVIEEVGSDYAVGIFDIFDFDTINRRLSIGLLVNVEFRGKGYASESLKLIEEYAQRTLNVHQIYCDVNESNERSVEFFKKNGYEISGVKKDWILSNNKFSNVLLFQKIL